LESVQGQRQNAPVLGQHRRDHHALTAEAPRGSSTGRPQAALPAHARREAETREEASPPESRRRADHVPAPRASADLETPEVRCLTSDSRPSHMHHLPVKFGMGCAGLEPVTPGRERGWLPCPGWTTDQLPRVSSYRATQVGSMSMSGVLVSWTLSRPSVPIT